MDFIEDADMLLMGAISFGLCTVIAIVVFVMMKSTKKPPTALGRSEDFQPFELIKREEM